MDRIVILDTWVNDTNIGNRVIMEAVTDELRDLFPGAFFYSVPALEFVRAGRALAREADRVFLAGTNLLSADMRRNSEWRIRLADRSWLRDVVLVGVGWWQYEDAAVTRYSQALLRGVLREDADHSVRDGYTARRLESLGLSALNTGCPSIWSLTPERCAAIPVTGSTDAVLTFTEYNQDPTADRALAEQVAERYETVYLWPQQYGDRAYGERILPGRFTVVDPTLEAFDELLSTQTLDYVGTRLHAGVRALQHGRRSIIVSVDNRATEMGRDFGLPVLERDDVGRLGSRLDEGWTTDVRLDVDTIRRWRDQF